MRLMFGRFHKEGMAARPEAMRPFAELLGHEPRSYRDFAVETAKQWPR